MNIVERFLRYVSFDTQSDENSGVTPSTPKQMVFAQYLKNELEALGLEEIELDEYGICMPLFLPIRIRRCRPLVSLLTWIPVLI